MGISRSCTLGHLDDRARRQARIEWEGFESAGWKTVCSFGVGPGPHEFEASLEDLRSAIYLAGDFDLLHREVEVRPVWTAIAGNEWRFEADMFADLVQRVVELEREFFQNFDHPFYLVTVIPIGEPGTGSRSMGGTGLTNSFSLAMLPDTEFGTPLGRRLGIAGLLVHEMFHEWAGQTIVPEDPEQLVYWFTEGFTDSYTRRLLLRGGVIGPDEYASSVNSKIQDLFSSPVYDAPNERIRTDFWQDRDVQRLPLRDGIVSGATPRIDSGLFEPCLEMRLEPVPRFDLGFDLDCSRLEGSIRGVREGTNAAAAGLRDEQKLRGWSVQFGDPEKPVAITVEEAGRERVITYLPVGAPVPTPQFFARPGASGCPRL